MAVVPSTSKHIPEDIQRHNEKELEKAKPGDMIQFPRELRYSHWAVYIGGDKVIHQAAETDDGLSTENVSVRLDTFMKVAKNSRAKINNFLDNEKEPLPAAEIVARAQSKLGAKGYNILFSNCEHFTTWCRYGEARSAQFEYVSSLVDEVGAKMKKKLEDKAQNHHSEEGRQFARALLGIGQKLGEVKKKVVQNNTDKELSNLKRKDDE